MFRARLFLIASLTLSVFATASGSATAFTEFTASEGVELNVKQKGNQVVEYKSGKVTVSELCTEMVGKLRVQGKKTELISTGSQPTWKGCNIAGLTTTVVNNCVFTFHITAVLDLGGSSCRKTEVPATKCIIKWDGAQSGLKALAYKNEGGNLVIENSLSGINFESAVGTNCGFEKAATVGTATYNGDLLVEATNAK